MTGFLHRALQLDLAVFTDLAKLWPLWVATPLLIVGLSLAGFGSRGVGKRLMIAGVAALAGWAIAAHAPGWLPFSVASSVLALSLGATSFLAPTFGAMIVGAGGGVWLGARFHPADHRLLTQVVLATIVGIGAGFGARRIAALLSAVCGAVLTTVAAIALLPLAQQESLAEYPAAPLLPMVVIATAGAAFQIAWSPRKRKSDHRDVHQSDADRRAA